MASKREEFEQILQTCLEMIRTEQVTVDSVLARYPEYADEMRPLLESASWLQERRKAVTPSPDFVIASRRRLEARLEREKAAGLHEAPHMEDLGLWSALVFLFTQKRFAYRYAIATLLVVLFIAITSSVAAASQRAIPGDTLYPVKTSLEQVNLALAFSEARRAQLNITFTERRLVEIRRLVTENRFEYLHSTINQFQAQADQASLPLRTLENSDALQAKALASELKNVINQQTEVLPALAQDAPEGAQQEITRLMNLTEVVRNEAERIEAKPLDTPTPTVKSSTSTATPVPPTPTITKTAVVTPVPDATSTPTSTPSPEDTQIAPTGTATPNGLPTPTVSPDVDEPPVPTTTMTPTPSLVVSFAEKSQTVSETRGALLISVQLGDSLDKEALASQDMNVPFSISGGAIKDSDFTISPSPLVISAGSSHADIVVNLKDDGVIEPDETITVTLGTPTNAVLGSPSTHTITITHGPTVFLTLASQSAHENARSVDIEVQLVPAQATAVSVPYRLGGTAILGQDYKLKGSNVLVIPAKQTKGYISLSLVADELDEPDETVEVTLGSPSGAILSLPSKQLVTLIDDDPQPEITFVQSDQSIEESVGNVSVQVQLSAASSLPITVPFSLSGSAILGTDYLFNRFSMVIPPGSSSASLTVQVVDDPVQESYETVVIAMGQPTNAVLGTPNAYALTLVDDDPQPEVTFIQSDQSVEESVGNVSVQVQLSAASSMTITVPFGLGGSAILGTDYLFNRFSVVIPPGSSSASLTVQVMDDPVQESSEMVMITMGQPMNAVIGIPSTQSITILPNDQPTCNIFATNEILLSADERALEWTLSNLGSDTLLLTQLTVSWQTGNSNPPNLNKVFYGTNLIFEGNEPSSPQTIISWIGLDSYRLLTSSPSTVIVRFTPSILPGNYILTLVFRNITQGYDCTPVIQSVDRL